MLLGLVLIPAAVSAAELIGFASLPADTFAEGPPAGGEDGSGAPIAANGRKGPFPGQPVQGFSAVQPVAGERGAYWFLSDNGFGAKRNSSDYLLRVYRVRPRFATETGGSGGVDVEGFLQLADPDHHVPFPIVNEETDHRRLTGADFDIESFAIDEDGAIRVGDEFGPFVLRFDATGRLLEAPIPTPDLNGMRLDRRHHVMSPDHPALPGSVQPNLPRSRGFEGMAGQGETLYLLLEGTVEGDPEGMLRFYEFDTGSGAFRGFAGFYPLEEPDHAIGDLAAIDNQAFLVLERDNRRGDEAAFKKVFRVDLGTRDRSGVVAKTEIADLLDIRDPHDLDGDGRTVFSFPFVTIENLLVTGHDTILVANDNNYPFSAGRATGIDDTEIILVRTDEPLLTGAAPR